MDDPHIDVAGAVALATASGVPRQVAAELITACAGGFRHGVASRRSE
jgi:hypothetical protein